MRITEFFKDAGKLGVGSEIAALILYGLAWIEHAQDKAVSAYVFISMSVALVFLGGFLAWNKKHEQVEEFRRREREVPRIKLKEFKCEQRLAEMRDSTGNVTDRLQMESLIVRFINDPEFPVQTAIAKDVIAHLEFFSIAYGSSPVCAFDGRWADSQQVINLAKTQTVKDILTTDIRIGETVELDIANRLTQEQDAYAVSNKPNANHKLGVGEFLVKVCLTGQGLAKTHFQFRFENRGKYDYLRPIA